MLNMEEEEQVHLLSSRQGSPVDKSFKLMNGRDSTTAFFPLDSKIGGQVSHDRPKVRQF